MSNWKNDYTDLVEHSYTQLEEKTIEHRSWSEEARQRVKQAHAAGMSVAEYFGEAVSKAKSKYDKSMSKSNTAKPSVKKKKIIKRVSGPIRKTNGKYMTNAEMRDAKEWARAQAKPNRNTLRNTYKKQTTRGSSLKKASSDDIVKRRAKQIIGDSKKHNKVINKQVSKGVKSAVKKGVQAKIDARKALKKLDNKAIKKGVQATIDARKALKKLDNKAIKKGVQAKIDARKALKKLDKKAVKNFKSVGKSKTDSIRKKAEREAIENDRKARALDKKWYKKYKKMREEIENPRPKNLRKKKTSKKLKKYKKIGKETAKQSVAGIDSIVRNSTKEMYGVANGSVRRKITKKKRSGHK